MRVCSINAQRLLYTPMSSQLKLLDEYKSIENIRIKFGLIYIGYHPLQHFLVVRELHPGFFGFLGTSRCKEPHSEQFRGCLYCPTQYTLGSLTHMRKSPPDAGHKDLLSKISIPRQVQPKSTRTYWSQGFIHPLTWCKKTLIKIITFFSTAIFINLSQNWPHMALVKTILHSFHFPEAEISAL